MSESTLSQVARWIARNTPLPATWKASVPLTPELEAEIVRYGEACAALGYETAERAA
jgi:hypothetical protein